MTQNKLFVLGLTGGAGTGKSTVMGYLKDRYHALILECDAIAASLQQPGGSCYQGMIDLFGEETVLPDGRLDRPAIAAKLFADPDLIEKVNALIHPAVRDLIVQRLAKEGLPEELSGDGPVKTAVIKSAILYKSELNTLCDEVWYIRADESVRRRRLKKSRGYDDGRIDRMMAAQKDEAFYRALADRVIDNTSEDLSLTFEQIDKGMKSIWNSVQ